MLKNKKAITSHCKLELLKKSHYLLTDPRIMLNFSQNFKSGLNFNYRVKDFKETEHESNPGSGSMFCTQQNAPLDLHNRA